jgi:putative ABC transport system permease protein
VLRLLHQISFRQLRASWGRTSLVVGGIATGVSLIVAINVINASVLENFQETIEVIAGPAQLEVTLGVGEIGFPGSVADAVRRDRDVVAAVPLVRGVLAFADDPSETLELFGADLTDEESLDRYRIKLTTDRGDTLTWLADPHSIALTTAFAARHRIDIGQVVRLATPQGVRDFIVRGLLEPDGIARAFGGEIALMDIQAAQAVLGKGEAIDQLDIVLHRGADTEAVARRLAGLMPASLTVARPATRGALYESILGSFQAMLSGFSLLCLVAGIYIIYNTTSTGAAQRSLGLAGLRFIGAEPAQLFRLLMVEAFVLGTLGALLGIPSGILLARLLTAMVSDSMGVVFQLRFPVEHLAISPTPLLRVAVIGVAAALFASYFAARRASALEPLAVLRPDMCTIGERTNSARLVSLWIVLVAVTGIALALEMHLKSIAWGNFGSTLWFASSIVIAVPLVSAVGPTVSRILVRLYGPIGRVASESVFRSSRRTGVTVSAIALVLTVAITFACLSLSHRKSVSSYFVSGFLASDLAVSAVATEGGWLETPLPGELADELRTIPGVRAAETIRILPGMIFREERLAIAALSDGLLDPERYPAGWYRAGDPARAAAEVRAGRGANVSISFADRFSSHVGDRIQLDTPTGRVDLDVVGIVPDYISDRGTIIISARLFVERWRDSAVNRLHLFLDPGASLEKVRGDIATQFGARYRLKILSLSEGVEYLAGKIDRAYAFTFAIQLLIVIVTVAGIFDLLLAAIWERRREFALWRVIGADERTVHRSVVLESATIGVLGAVLGVAVGLVTAWIWIGINYRYLLGYYLEYHFALGTTAWFVFLVLTMTILAGYAAARQATSRSVLDGIQAE